MMGEKSGDQIKMILEENAMDPIKPDLEADQHSGACIPSDLMELGLSCCTMSAVGSGFTGALTTLRVNQEDESMPSHPRSESREGLARGSENCLLLSIKSIQMVPARQSLAVIYGQSSMDFCSQKPV